MAKAQKRFLPESNAKRWARGIPASAALLLTIVTPITAHTGADTSVFNVKAAFYDQPIGGIDGEFGARKINECGYSAKGSIEPTGRSFDIVPHMVQDTLAYSKELGKKIPLLGPVQCNSSEIEKWFNPAFASAVSCQDLAFKQSLDSLGYERISYIDTMFFPIDSLAPPGQLEGDSVQFRKDPGLGPGYSGVHDLTYPPGYSGEHNFNWCMEINAQFKYKQHETFQFTGDDDVWVFLDNKLVVDLGGIHGTPGLRTIAIDTLPFIQGRAGETFDFDLYFCERRPAGSSFKMLTNLDLKPVKFQDLEIVQSDKTVLNPKEPVIGKKRLCAMPLFSERFCGNDVAPPPGPFYPATWTLNGTVLAKDSACIDLDPGDLPINKRITLAAKAEGKTAKLNLQVIKANIPGNLVLKGNGRLDRLEIAMDARSDSLEAPARIDYPFAGKQNSDSAYGDAFDPVRRVVALQLAGDARGPCGVSSLDTGKGLFSQTVLGYPLSFPMTVIDSISPILRSAAWQPEPLRGDLHLDFVPSESMSADFPHQVHLSFKNRLGRVWHLDLADAKALPSHPDSFRVAFPDHADFEPKDVDSVSFASAASDAAGNAAQAYFIPIPPVGWSSGRAEVAGVGLESSLVKSSDFTPIIPSTSLVLVDKGGNPLQASGDNISLAQSNGPVLSIKSADRLDRLEVSVFSNLGVPVDRGSYTFTDDEWSRLVTDAGGDTAVARVLWYPSSNGNKLGTGVYIMEGWVTTKRTFTLDANGEWREKTATRRPFGPILFGYLRR